MTDLKPCPFCGGKADYENEGNGSFAEWYYCMSCGASSRQARCVDPSAWNRRASGWISVEERLPDSLTEHDENCQPILAVFVDSDTKVVQGVTLMYHENSFGWCHNEDGPDGNLLRLSVGHHITHWMPLPEPPEKP